MHPMLALFLKLTALVTLGIVLLVVAAFLLKIAYPRGDRRGHRGRRILPL